MTATAKWNIAELERHTADGIVYTAHYTVDANNGTYSAGAHGSIGLEQPDPNDKIEEIKAALQAMGMPWAN